MQICECLICKKTFFQKFCVFNSFEEVEMDTVSLYLAVLHGSLEDCIKLDMREACNNIRMNNCSNTLAADSSNILLPRSCCSKDIKHDKREPEIFREVFRCTEMTVCAVKPIAALVRAQTKSSSVARDSTNERWRNLVLDPWKSSGAYWTRKQTCNQLIEASELSNIQSARTSKLQEVYHISILRKLYSMMAYTRNHFFCKWNDSMIIMFFLDIFQI